MDEIPTLETQRLLVRPFRGEELEAVHRLLDIELQEDNLPATPLPSREERAAWLEWTVLGYRQLALLHQPPLGDRGVALKGSGELIGACGFTPVMNAFEQIPYFAPQGQPVYPGRYTIELGLYYAVSPAHRRRGYAAEAARALVDYAFQILNARRLVATTTYDNHGSLGVMRRLGMRIERNPYPDPPWLQAVGVLENPINAP